MPNARLAVLPGTTHITVIEQTDLLLAIIPRFLDAPLQVAIQNEVASECTFARDVLSWNQQARHA